MRRVVLFLVLFLVIGFVKADIFSIQADGQCLDNSNIQSDGFTGTQIVTCRMQEFVPTKPSLQFDDYFAQESIAKFQISWKVNVPSSLNFWALGCTNLDTGENGITRPGRYHCTEAVFLLVGLTLGELDSNGFAIGSFCNEGCYVDDFSTAQIGYSIQSMHNWVDVYVAPPNGIAGVSSVIFKFRSSVFNKTDYYYGIVSALWRARFADVYFDLKSIEGGEQKLFRVTNVRGTPAQDFCPKTGTYEYICELDRLFNRQSFRLFKEGIYPPLRGTNAQITSIQVSDNRPALNDIIEVTIRLKNTGSATSSFIVGLTLSQGSALCNRNCYVDGLGDFAIVRDVPPNDEVVVKRKFKIRDDFFTPGSASFIVAVRPYRELSYHTTTQSITLLTITQKYPVVATSLRVTKPVAKVGEVLEFTPFIHNRQNNTIEVFVVVSLGKWNANENTVYNDFQPIIDVNGVPMAPCNSKCLRDGKPIGIPLVMEGGSIETVTRKIVIPDYLQLANSTDVQVAIFKYSKDLLVSEAKSVLELPKESLLSVVYFKDVINISETPSLSVGVATGFATLLDSFEEGIARAFAIEPETQGAKIVSWLILGSIFMMTFLFMSLNITRKLNITLDMNNMVFLLTVFFVAWIIGGSFAGKIPAWMTLLVIALIVIFFARRQIGELIGR